MFTLRNVCLCFATLITVMIFVSMASSLLPAQETAPAPAQNGGGQGRGPGGGGGGWGGGGPGGGRQGMLDRLKEALGASDDEWKVLQPRVEKVMTLAMQARVGMGRGGRGGGGGGRGGEGGGPGAGGPGGENRPAPSEVAKAAEDLRKLMENKDASNDDIKAKLEALRAAKDKAKQELIKAQSDLKEVLNLRQEATLVSFGMLD